jgi:hypothetical protein
MTGARFCDTPTGETRLPGICPNPSVTGQDGESFVGRAFPHADPMIVGVGELSE